MSEGWVIISDLRPILIIAYFNFLHYRCVKKLLRIPDLKTDFQYLILLSFYG